MKQLKVPTPSTATSFEPEAVPNKPTPAIIEDTFQDTLATIANESLHKHRIDSKKNGEKNVHAQLKIPTKKRKKVKK